MKEKEARHAKQRKGGREREAGARTGEERSCCRDMFGFQIWRARRCEAPKLKSKGGS